MAKRIVLAGGSGFIGQSLMERFSQQGYEVIVLSRGPARKSDKAIFVEWDGKNLGDWAATLEGAEMVINLAGKSVDCRYHEKNKKAILDSRVDSTIVLGQAIQKSKNPPKLWINSSTATIYRHALDRPMDEFDGELGEGFSVEVAKAWEKSFFECETPQTRQVALRSAIVLGSRGGVLIPFKNLVLLGLGGIQGDGRQMFSWIHEEDFFEIIRFIQARDLKGVVNVSAPNPISNREIMRALRKILHRPFGLPAPVFLLKWGAWLLRTETELLLKSRWVLPTRLLREGYFFKYPVLQEALANLL
jgi:uncharacterized protein